MKQVKAEFFQLWNKAWTAEFSGKVRVDSGVSGRTYYHPSHDSHQRLLIESRRRAFQEKIKIKGKSMAIPGNRKSSTPIKSSELIKDMATAPIASVQERVKDSNVGIWRGWEETSLPERMRDVRLENRSEISATKSSLKLVYEVCRSILTWRAGEGGDGFTGREVSFIV
ncbi:hypothetical protein BT96DRAFT_978566 [Gymnopus androsaceus JB14]|uniref:Uncharacterized protein n=1 Tax=Gymnopus androsaceus JB14 TaxID=1447944 RepID=A0A6A4H950_9AGAR|nr:hypothetical protein BT96DRAFT_978566 [Gymnopus androsaceus JB14]